MVSFSVCSVSLYDFPVFVGQQSRALFEQLGEPAGGGVPGYPRMKEGRDEVQSRRLEL